MLKQSDRPETGRKLLACSGIDMRKASQYSKQQQKYVHRKLKLSPKLFGSMCSWAYSNAWLLENIFRDL